MSQEDFRLQQEIAGKASDPVSIRLTTSTHRLARQFCDEKKMSLSKLIEALLHHHLVESGAKPDRTGLAVYAAKLKNEVESHQKACAPLFQEFRTAYDSLG